MKTDAITKAYLKSGVVLNQNNLNSFVKAVILNFPDGEVIVENDNFGTRRKYMDFTNGRIKAGLNPYQIVFTDLSLAHICGDRYIDNNNDVKYF